MMQTLQNMAEDHGFHCLANGGDAASCSPTRRHAAYASNEIQILRACLCTFQHPPRMHHHSLQPHLQILHAC